VVFEKAWGQQVSGVNGHRPHLSAGQTGIDGPSSFRLFSLFANPTYGDLSG
jgi:hypothetical protein